MPITKTDKKKNGLQGYRVIVNYTDTTGAYKKIERTAYGKAEAQALEAKLLNDVRSGETSTRMKMSALCDEYLHVKSSEVRETTLNQIRQHVERVIAPMLGSHSLDTLNAKILQDWKNKVNEIDIAVRTKRGYYATLSGILNYAVSRGYMPQNPLVRIGNFKEVFFDKPQDALHYYTPDQYLSYSAAALDYAAEKDTLQSWGFYVFFSVAYYTGCRKGEINALKWSDIDNNIMHIRRSIAQKLKGNYRETPPKNKSSYRDIQLPSTLLDILAEHKQRQMLDPLFTDDWRVCGGSKCLSDTTIDLRNRQFADAAGLPRIRIHDFRHSHATLLANNAINIQEIARRLGHSNVEQTWNTYAHLYPREEERAVSVLEKIHELSTKK